MTEIPFKTEEEVLKFWEEIDAFKQSIKNNEQGPEFIFYDGPPFATGLPHYGHIVASTLKDIIPRYKTQMGFRVDRHWGWDCVAEGTLISLPDGTSVPIEHLEDMKTNVLSYDSQKNGVLENEMTSFFNQGTRNCIELIFENGTTLTCTPDHKIMTSQGFIEADKLIINETEILVGLSSPKRLIDKSIKSDFLPTYKTKLFSKKKVGLKKVYDICVPQTSSFLANGIIVHNCHGLPIEYEIEKELGIKTRQEVQEFGIANYNEACRDIVLRYSQEWRKTITRLGRWVDFDHDYKTMDKTFMESVWWVFRQLWDQGRIYQSVKVMPYSTGCRTPLSNFEAKSNYKKVKDPSVTVKFKLVVDQKAWGGLHLSTKFPVYFLVWTTTPWTLTSNLAICINGDLAYDYLETEEKRADLNGEVGPVGYIIGQANVAKYFGKQKYKRISSLVGYLLTRLSYEPLFHYIDKESYPKAFRLVHDPYVKVDNGTGLVHQAPTFGEDDFRVCSHEDIVSRDRQPPELINSHGVFENNMVGDTDVDPDLSGLYFKQADEPILNNLKTRGLLFKKDWEEHDYPYCWRSDTPLMYKTVKCWFIEVKSLQDKLLVMNEQVHWVPEFIGQGRFKEWLGHCQDWCVSRNRYWGTPIPIWMSEDGEERVCIGSVAELEEKAGLEPGTVKDLHSHHVDQITIPSQQGKGDLRRTTEVMDCWFESGSMPYGQYHYPFENKELFEANFPCDFIAEGADQTRGWFYTLLVLSAALFDRPAYKNVIVNGMVLAEDGEKMSKRKKNYPPPNGVLDKYGADALRLYLIDSKVVKADSLKFKEDGLHLIVKNVHFMIRNMLQYWLETKEHFEKMSGRTWSYQPVVVTDLDWNHSNSEHEQQFIKKNYRPLKDPLDSWILACLDKYLTGLHQTMDKYDLSPILESILEYIDLLSRWYIKLSKTRLRLEDQPSSSRIDDVETGTSVLFASLYYFSVGLAPFAPFLAEIVYQALIPYLGNKRLSGLKEQSVHFHQIPRELSFTQDSQMTVSMNYLIKVLNMIRLLRSQRKMATIKLPYKKAILIHPDPLVLGALERVANIVQGEGNVLELAYNANWDEFVDFKLKPNFKVLGPKLGRRARNLKKYLDEFDEFQTLDLVKHRSGFNWYDDDRQIDIDSSDRNCYIEFDELVVETEPKSEFSNWQMLSEGELAIMLDPQIDSQLLQVYCLKQFTRQIQDLRRKLGLQMADRVVVVYECHETNQEFTDKLFEDEQTLAETEHLVGRLIKREQLEKYLDNLPGEQRKQLKSLGQPEELVLDSEKSNLETKEKVTIELLL